MSNLLPVGTVTEVLHGVVEVQEFRPRIVGDELDADVHGAVLGHLQLVGGDGKALDRNAAGLLARRLLEVIRKHHGELLILAHGLHTVEWEVIDGSRLLLRGLNLVRAGAVRILSRG